ncbi:MAG: phospholipase [Actinomycetes bacterium]
MSPLIEHVAWSNAEQERAGTPLVVALHGRGADESSMIELTPYLPDFVTVAAPRAPITLDQGYAWFANRGIGRPIEDSIKATGAALFSWLDKVAAVHSHVIVLGFSGGTAMAGGLILERPHRFAGAALLSGTLPWDAGYDTSLNRLAALPVLWSIDVDDAMIPRDLVERSEEWLRESSGASLLEFSYPGIGHSMTIDELADVSTFIADVLD